MATYWAFSPRRRPRSTSAKKTSAGSTGMAAMISCWPTVSISPLLAPHRVDLVHVNRPARAEHGQDYREPDRYLRRGYRDDQDRVAHPEPPGVRKVVRESHEGKVHGVDHQLHAHEHHYRVAPHQRAPRPDGEHDRTHDQVRLQRRRGGQRLNYLLNLRRHRWHYSLTPRSTPSPLLRRLTTMAATTATRRSTDATSKSRTKISDPALTPSRSLPNAATSRGPFPGLVDPQSSAERT